MRVKKGGPPEAVNQAAQHVLFVEGTEDGVDVTWLKPLFLPPLEVKPLGASFHVKSVAQALHPHHPTYYFLTDRDHATDHEVETTWNNFPDTTTHNLLIWPRKEIESYFVDPELFAKSEYLKPRTRPEQVRDYVVRRAQEALFQAAANAAIVQIREEMKVNWLEVLPRPFAKRAAAELALVAAIQSSPLPGRVRNCCDAQFLAARYQLHLEELTGGGESIHWGMGRWLSLLPAKKLLNDMISEFTSVKDDNNRLVQGPQRLRRVVGKLLEDDASLPGDFRRLRTLIDMRIRAS